MSSNLYPWEPVNCSQNISSCKNTGSGPYWSLDRGAPTVSMELRGMYLNSFINLIWSWEIYNFVNIHYFLGLALPEIAGIIEDVLSSTEKSPVFVLKDLVNMYKEILLDYGANEESIREVYSTKIKESIMKHASCSYEKKKEKIVLLTLEDHAIFEASKTSSFDTAIILSKATKVILHHLFSSDQVFDGDLSYQKQTASIQK